MTDPNYLAVFSGWLRVMGEDVLSLANLLETPDAPLPFRHASAELTNASRAGLSVAASQISVTWLGPMS